MSKNRIRILSVFAAITGPIAFHNSTSTEKSFILFVTAVLLGLSLGTFIKFKD